MTVRAKQFVLPGFWSFIVKIALIHDRAILYFAPSEVQHRTRQPGASFWKDAVDAMQICLPGPFLLPSSLLEGRCARSGTLAYYFVLALFPMMFFIVYRTAPNSPVALA